MKPMKRIISFLLAAAMVFSMLPVSALAEEWETEPETEITVPTEETTEPAEESTEPAEESTEPEEEPAELTEEESEPEADDVDMDEPMDTVPDAAAEYGVIAEGEWYDLSWVLDSSGTFTMSGTGSMRGNYVGGPPFYAYKDDIKSVVILPGITSIGNGVFKQCDKLESVSIPNTVEKIDSDAFNQCKSLKSVVIPDSVTEIYSEAFYYCTSLETVKLSSNLKMLRYETFYHCTSLKEINIPNGVTEIASMAFASCTSLSSVRLPGTLKDISSEAFWNTAITDIDIPYGVETIGNSAFSRCYQLEKVTIPNTVTRIYPYAFSDCGKLKSVVIPGSVAIIDDRAFSNTGVETVIIENGVQQIGASAFRFCGYLTSITFPASVKKIENAAFGNCTGLSKITFEGDAPSFGYDSFYNVTADCYYPRSNPTWTPQVRKDYGGKLNWGDSLPASRILYYTKWDPSGKTAYFERNNTVKLKTGSNTKSAFLNDPAKLVNRYVIVEYKPAEKTGESDEIISMKEADSRVGVIKDTSENGFAVGDTDYLYTTYAKKLSLGSGVPVLIHLDGGKVGRVDILSEDRKTIVSVSRDTVKLRPLDAQTGGTDVKISYIADGDTRSFLNEAKPGETITKYYTDIMGMIVAAGYIRKEVHFLSGFEKISGTMRYLLTCDADALADQMDTQRKMTINAILGRKTNSPTLFETDDSVPAYTLGLSEDNLNHYFLLTTEWNLDRSGHDIVLKSETVTSNTGVIRSIESDGLILEDFSIIGQKYKADKDIALTSFNPKDVVMYHLNAGVIVGVELLREYTGLMLSSATTPGAAVRIHPEREDDNTLILSLRLSAAAAKNDRNIDTYTALDYLTERTAEGVHDQISYYLTQSGFVCRVETDFSMSAIHYLAFSNLAYETWKTGETVKSHFESGKTWEDPAFKDMPELKCSTMYRQIANWKAVHMVVPGAGYEAGFYAVVFEREKKNGETETVIAYRGSTPPDKILTADGWNDWMENDLPFQVLNEYTQQLDNALDFYDKYLVKKPEAAGTITVTGHSLGGGLASLITVARNVRGEVFNTAYTYKALYYNRPGIAGQCFMGADKWNLRNHHVLGDPVSGFLYQYNDFPHYLYEQVHYINVFGNHGLECMVAYDPQNEKAVMKQPIKSSEGISESDFNDIPVYLGSSENDNKVLKGTALAKANIGGVSARSRYVMYGGDGDDTLTMVGSISDVIVGGKGWDIADGGKGDDTYYYFKGDDHMVVHDADGNDTIMLKGFLESDRLQYVINGYFGCIQCNGREIVAISLHRSSKSTLQVFVNDRVWISNGLVFEWSGIKTSVMVACPTDVDILNTRGDVVLTLKNGTEKTTYTSYGNFYVFTDEDGESVKYADMIDGYSFRIRGTGNGTMNVTYCQDEGEEYTLTDIPVTFGMTATVSEITESEPTPGLLIDYDSDGTADECLPMASIEWEIEEDGTLVISGSGPMEDYEWGTAPWYPYASQIRAIEVQEGVTAVGERAFDACYNAVSVSLPESLKKIGQSAFGECLSLEAMTIPAGVEEIGFAVFQLDRMLKRIDVAAGNRNYCSMDGVLFSKDMTELICHPAGRTEREYRIPDGVKLLQDCVFGADALKTVRVPGSVETLESFAFLQARNLENIIVEDSSKTYSDIDGVLFDKAGTMLLDYPMGKTAEVYAVPYGTAVLGKSCFVNSSAKRIVLPDTLREVQDYVLTYKENVELVFTGNAPTFTGWDIEPFQGSVITAYYPVGDSTWTASVRQNYGGTVTWTAADILEDLKCYIGDLDREPLELTQDYLLLRPGQTAQMHLKNENPALLARVEWYTRVYGDTLPCSVSSTGEVTAYREGTAYALARITLGDREYDAVCRIDVTGTPVAPQVQENGVTLAENKLTVQLYQTDYTRVKVVLNLPQNLEAVNSALPADAGIAVQEAAFVSADMNRLFRLRAADDRTLEIIPTAEALNNPGAVKGSYKSAIVLTVDGAEIPVPEVTLTVRKTLPTIKAKTVKLNSFDPRPAALSFTGGTVTAVEPNGTLPSGFALDGGNVVYMGSLPKVSAKLNLLAEVQGLAVKCPVTVSVSVARTAPTVKLSASSVTLMAGTGDTAVLTAKLSPAEFAEHPLTIRLTDSTGQESKALNCTVSGNEIRIRNNTAAPAGTYKLTVLPEGADKAAAVTVKVVRPTKAPKLTMKTSGSIDQTIPGSSTTVTVNISGYHAGTSEYWWLDVYESSGKGMPETEVTDNFGFVRKGNTLVITASNLRKGCTYTLVTKADLNQDGEYDDCEGRIRLPVKWSDPGKVPVTVTLKTKGSIDVLRPGTEITVTPTIKNWFLHTPSENDLVFYTGSGKTLQEITGKAPFRVRMQDGAYVLTADGAVSGVKYSAAFRAVINGKTVTSKPVSLSVKMGSVKVTQNTKTVTLTAKDCRDSEIISIVPTDASLKGIEWISMDSKSSQYFSLRSLGGGRCQLSFRGFAVQPGTKSMTVKLNVWMEGNNTGKANAVVSVKVTVK